MLVNIGGMVAGECCIAYTYSMHRAHVTITLQYVKATSQTLLFILLSLSLFHFYQLLDSSSLYVLKHSLYCITDMAVHCGFCIHPCYFGCRRREWHQYWRQITSILGPNCSNHCSCNLQWHSRRWAFPRLLSRCRCFLFFTMETDNMILNDIKAWRWVWWVFHLAWTTLYSWMR